MKTSHTLNLILSSVFATALMVSGTAFANNAEKQKNNNEPKVQQYRLVYAKNSPMKDLSLNNAEIKVHMYFHGAPKGHQTFKTNEQGEFEFAAPKHAHHKNMSLNLVQLQDDAKNNEMCEGALVHGKNELMVTCHKKHNHKSHH